LNIALLYKKSTVLKKHKTHQQVVLFFFMSFLIASPTSTSFTVEIFELVTFIP